MKLSLNILVILLGINVLAQKKSIDHQAYNSWKKLSHQEISSNGKFISYEIKPYRGNGYLYLYDVESDKLDSVSRGYKASFSKNNKLFVYQIKADFDTLRNCELNKVKKENWPTDTLVIHLLASDSVIKIPTVKSYKLAKNSDWVHYMLTTNEKNEPLKKTDTIKVDTIQVEPTQKNYWQKITSKFYKKECITALIPSKEKKKKPETDGKIYIAFNPFKNKSLEYANIITYDLSENGKYVSLVEHQKNEQKIDEYTLKVLNPNNKNIKYESKPKTQISKPKFNNHESQLVYISSNDTTKLKDFELNLITLKTGKNQKIIDTNSLFIPEGKHISQYFTPLFTEDDSHLFFGVRSRENKYEKDSLLASEKAVVDIWHFEDSRLQSQQLVNLKSDLRKSTIFSYDIEEKSGVQISSDSLGIAIPEKLKTNYVFAYNTKPYEATYQWDSPWREDHYRIDIKTGKSELLRNAVGFGGKLSPSGKFYTYFDGIHQEHKLINNETKKEICISCDRKDVTWVKDNNGTPQLAAPYRVIGWLKGEETVLLKSEYDLWKYEISTKELTSISNEQGFKAKEKINLFNFQRDSLYIDFNEIILIGVNDTTGNHTIYKLDTNELDTLQATNHEIVSINKAIHSDEIIIRKSSLNEYPELLLTDKSFKTAKQISHTNPQQNEYNWATVEKISWVSYNGDELDGLVYKPVDFELGREYPMLVYYYEISSDRIHYYYSPKPTASIIYPTEYASAGYVVFMPDIKYVEGYPAQSAYDCIMSGVDKVLKLYPNIDSKRMGLQGQSWGGYQTAQLITMTDRFAAAMAGAPVSNMFSAYGGIRWGSGLNRQFQYEKQQSRIGKTIWEAPELYVENSPLFHLPKVQTPLLIMANDNDGAVPWYQGIELFTGMKRLSKPCWMLNYNGDKHNLMKAANRMDLSIRMRQFFDYYLQGKAAPKWLIEGIPAVDKGKDYGFELVE